MVKIPPRATDRAYARLKEINAARLSEDKVFLRVAVEGGGCSGFQYDITLSTSQSPEDLALEKDGQVVLVDEVSLPFLEGAVIDFSRELIGDRFVIENPNAVSSCGCGTSFAI